MTFDDIHSRIIVLSSLEYNAIVPSIGYICVGWEFHRQTLACWQTNRRHFDLLGRQKLLHGSLHRIRYPLKYSWKAIETQSLFKGETPTDGVWHSLLPEFRTQCYFLSVRPIEDSSLQCKCFNAKLKLSVLAISHCLSTVFLFHLSF